jgi:rhamnosyltransferase
MNKPDVSIIIRTLNEQRYLGDLLQGIKDQQTKFTYEIVLIDSGSTDSTLNIAKQFGCRILHISRDEFSFGRSLNRACEASLGTFLVFVSGHCIPYDQHWLQNLVKPLYAGSVQYCYGRQVGGPHTYLSESQIFSKYFPKSSSLPQEGFYCNNANSSLNADVWRKYRFDEDLTGLEDMHLAKRLIAQKGLVGYAANACVYHLHHENWRQIQRRFEREALALQQISPEILLRRRDIIRYFVRAVFGDIMIKPHQILNAVSVYKIFRYRFHQYLGSYNGNHLHKRVSSELRDTYFYPTLSKGNPLTSRSLTL